MSETRDGSAAGAIEADVVVFGGGVTGLAIAHELAERSLRVVVVEPAFEGSSPWPRENPGLGGVARSQWAFIAQDAVGRGSLQTMQAATSLPFGLGTLSLPVEVDGGRVAIGAAPEGGIRLLLRAMTKIPGSRVVCRLYHPQGADPPEGAELRRALSTLLDGVRRAMTEPGVEALALGEADLACAVERVETAAPSLDIELSVYALPGEHGFRFFPSFYRHVFDTMRRIPATVPVDGSRRGRDTVFDNLVSVETVGYVGDAEGPTAKIPRRSPRSAEEFRNVLKGLFRKTGYSGADVLRLSLKVWKYATTSRARREAEYEDMSWYDFVEGERFSARGRFLLESTPGTLGGLFGSEADARTQGTILLQCLRDQVSDGGGSDMLLNGPTDEAWFAHWYRYLRAQGVRFERATLADFELSGDAIVPVVLRDPEGPRGASNRLVFASSARPVCYALALPLLPAHALAERFVALAKARGVEARDFSALLAFPRRSPEELRREMQRPYPSGPLRHLSGIQYFFNQDLRLLGAHTMYLDAGSGLTAIAQGQFWLTPRGRTSGYRSVLSVDVAIWAPMRGRSRDVWHAWGRSRAEIAEGVWEQLCRAHAGDYPSPWPRLPRPAAFHLDDNLVFSEGGGGVLMDDRTPFLVNEKGRFRSRPGGAPDDAHPSGVTIAYDVALGQYVLAGTFMQTRTRINSMEAACESARHAVNAILERLDLPGDPCEVWDPEDFEDAAMDPDKEIDAQLFEQGIAHMGEILGVDRVDEWLPRDDDSGQAPP